MQIFSAAILLKLLQSVRCDRVITIMKRVNFLRHSVYTNQSNRLCSAVAVDAIWQNHNTVTDNAVPRTLRIAFRPYAVRFNKNAVVA